MDRRIKLINEYVSRLTQGKVVELHEAKPNIFRVNFRTGTAKIELQVYLQQDILSIRSALFNLSQIKDERSKMELFQEILQFNSQMESVSAKFGVSEDHFVEVLFCRKDLKDLDYSEFFTALKNVSMVADGKGAQIIARYTTGSEGEMNITPLDA